MQEKIMDPAMNPAIPNGQKEKYRVYISVNNIRYYFQELTKEEDLDAIRKEFREKGVTYGYVIEREKEPEVKGWKG